MTRDQLEAQLWQIPGIPAYTVDAILANVDSHVAAALGEIDNYRRNRQPVIHLEDDFITPACNRTGTVKNPVLTFEPENVTCASCRRTASYRERSSA